MRLSTGTLLFVIVSGCEVGTERAAVPPEANAPAPGTSEVDRPHVVFTRPALVLDRIGVPVSAPVTTPSQPSQLTLRSDDPGVVAVDGSGMLVAMGPGRTNVRATGGDAALEVTVVAPAGIRVRPERLSVLPGAQARVTVVTAEGVEVPAEAVRWHIAPGVPVAVVRGQVLSMGGVGRFEVTAEVAGARAVLPVTIELAGTLKVAVSPPRTRMRPGQVSAFQLYGPQGDVRAEWSSTEPAVLVAIGGGMFQARKPGRARACAAALDRVSCSEVEVTP